MITELEPHRTSSSAGFGLNKVWEASDFPVETKGQASASEVKKIEKEE